MTHSDHALMPTVILVARNAALLAKELADNDVIMAHSFGLLLLGQLGGLVVDLELEVRRLPTIEHERVNPYRDVPIVGSTTQEGVQRLSADDLLELCRWTNWTHDRRVDQMARWWLSKRMTILVLELESRGFHPESWQDGTESQ